MLSLLVLLVALALAAPLFLLHYLSRLPDAPGCPTCRAVTCEGRSGFPPSVLDRFCALLEATPVRSCTSCGWAGRMRWRWAGQKSDNGAAP
jgi:hypothetical protein